MNPLRPIKPAVPNPLPAVPASGAQVSGQPAGASLVEGGTNPAQSGGLPGANEEEARERLSYYQSLNRTIRWILTLLLIETFCLAAINGYQLRRLRNQPPPSYKIAFASSSSSAVVCHATLKWDNAPALSDRLGPRVRVSGHEPPCNLTLPPTQGQIRSVPLTFAVPEECSPGLWMGRLKLDPLKSSVADFEPAQFPITFHVRSWPQQWSLVRAWLLFLMISYGLIYLLCLIWLAAPKGFLMVKMSNEREPRRIQLRALPSSWLFPWWRCMIPLTWLQRRLSGISNLAGHQGALWFDRCMLPILEFTSTSDLIRCLNQHPARNPRPENGFPCGQRVYLYEQTAIVFWDSKWTVSATLYLAPEHSSSPGRFLPPNSPSRVNL